MTSATTTSFWQAQAVPDAAADAEPGARVVADSHDAARAGAGKTSSQPVRCDYAILGAGIAGASAAYWIRSLEPKANVALIDRHTPASGASGRNAGFLLCGTARGVEEAASTVGRERTLWHYDFTRRSIEHLLSHTEPRAYGLAHTGSLVAAGDEEEADELREGGRVLCEAGHEAVYWSAHEIHRRLYGVDFHGGLFDPNGATVDPLRLVNHLVARSGATLFENHTAQALVSESGLSRIETDRGSILASRVVVALNAYLPLLLPALGQFVRPVRAQMLAAAPERPFVLETPVYSHRGYFYTRSADGGLLLVGGARHRHEKSEVGYDDVTTPDLQSDLEDYVQQHFPSTGALRVVSRWSGTMGFSPDGLPVVGMLPGDAGCFAAGFTGHGMAYGFGIGRLLAKIATGADDEGELSAFSSSRFG